MSDNKLLNTLFETTEIEEDVFKNPEIAHLFIHHNKVLGKRTLDGLTVDTEEIEDGVKVRLHLAEGVIIKNPVHLCFGLFHQEGTQRIIMDVKIEKRAKISILSHCAFPNPIKIKHIMDADIEISEGAEYSYLERHVHGFKGGIEVYPKAKVRLGKNAKFKTDFELLKGRVGLIDIDYKVICEANSVLEMNTKINGTGDDVIKINEEGELIGEHSSGVLTSRVALRDKARAEVYSKLIATAAYARGHVDCKEIVQDNGVAKAVPVVEVRHPKAHITHEAAIGSVDSKRLQTLLARGLTEEKAVDLIIQGLLR